jgi:phosphatidylglycerophosphatase A
MDRAARILSTWFGAGLLPRAPGTWGSLAALPFAWAIGHWGGTAALLIASILLFALAVPAAQHLVTATGQTDPQIIVVDEVVGQWLTLAVAPLDPWSYLIGFVLFRLADIVKPFPANWADREIKGGLGVMLDDVFAAIYSAAGLWGILRLMGRL